MLAISVSLMPVLNIVTQELCQVRLSACRILQNLSPFWSGVRTLNLSGLRNEETHVKSCSFDQTSAVLELRTVWSEHSQLKMRVVDKRWTQITMMERCQCWLLFVREDTHVPFVVSVFTTERDSSVCIWTEFCMPYFKIKWRKARLGWCFLDVFIRAITT